MELGLAGAQHVTVVNRSEAPGADLVSLLRGKLTLDAQLAVWQGDFAVPADTDIVINATSIGLYDADARIPLALGALTPRMIIADVVFNPPRTRLIRDAEARGCRTLDGLGMIVQQGVISIEYWTGISPDPVVMRRAVEEAAGLRGGASCGR